MIKDGHVWMFSPQNREFGDGDATGASIFTFNNFNQLKMFLNELFPEVKLHKYDFKL